MGLKKPSWLRYRDSQALDLYNASEENIARFDKTGAIAYLRGGVGPGTAFTIDCGGAYPNIQINYNSNLNLYAKSGGNINFYDSSTRSARLTYASNVTTFSGGNVTGDDLVLNSNLIDNKSRITLEGAGDIYLETDGFVKFGSYTGNADTPVTGYVTIRDSGGTSRKLAVVDP